MDIAMTEDGYTYPIGHLLLLEIWAILKSGSFRTPRPNVSKRLSDKNLNYGGGLSGRDHSEDASRRTRRRWASARNMVQTYGKKMITTTVIAFFYNLLAFLSFSSVKNMC